MFNWSDELYDSVNQFSSSSDSFDRETAMRRIEWEVNEKIDKLRSVGYGDLLDSIQATVDKMHGLV